MKFLHYFALIATTAAIRLQQTETATPDELFNLDTEVEKKVYSPEEVWKHFDKNGDGQWNLKEAKTAFKQIMKYYGHPLPEGWKKAVKYHFKQADKNDNGQISVKEAIGYMFQMIDQNDDGFWQPKEVYAAIRQLASFTGNKLIPEWKEHVNKAMEYVDANNDGKVSPKEFYKALAKYGFPNINDLFEKEGGRLDLSSLLEEGEEVEKRIPSPEEVWKKFDKNGDGEWDLKETKAAFKGAMKYFGHKMPEGWKKMVADEFKKADKDGSGKVTPMEMAIYMFEMIDSNDDGAWDLKEVKDALRAMAQFTKNKLKKGWEEMVEGVFNHVDKNSDGKASPKEIMAALKKHGVPDINELFE